MPAYSASSPSLLTDDPASLRTSTSTSPSSSPIGVLALDKTGLRPPALDPPALVKGGVESGENGFGVGGMGPTLPDSDGGAGGKNQLACGAWGGGGGGGGGAKGLVKPNICPSSGSGGCGCGMAARSSCWRWRVQKRQGGW